MGDEESNPVTRRADARKKSAANVGQRGPPVGRRGIGPRHCVAPREMLKECRGTMQAAEATQKTKCSTRPCTAPLIRGAWARNATRGEWAADEKRAVSKPHAARTLNGKSAKRRERVRDAVDTVAQTARTRSMSGGMPSPAWPPRSGGDRERSCHLASLERQRVSGDGAKCRSVRRGCSQNAAESSGRLDGRARRRGRVLTRRRRSSGRASERFAAGILLE